MKAYADTFDKSPIIVVVTKGKREEMDDMIELHSFMSEADAEEFCRKVRTHPKEKYWKYARMFDKSMFAA